MTSETHNQCGGRQMLGKSIERQHLKLTGRSMATNSKALHRCNAKMEAMNKQCPVKLSNKTRGQAHPTHFLACSCLLALTLDNRNVLAFRFPSRP